MGLFSKLKKEKTAVDWSNAYTATPKFYAKPDGSPFGAIALTEAYMCKQRGIRFTR